MAPVRRDHLREIIYLQERMSRLFDEALLKYKGCQGSAILYPPVDIYETEDSVILKAEVPGLEISDISIEVAENTLILRGDRRHANLAEENFHRMERFYGSFQRAFTMPYSVSRSEVTAKLADGVLKIVIPKKDDSDRGIRIKVQ